MLLYINPQALVAAGWLGFVPSSSRAFCLLRHRTQPITASSMTRMISAVLTMGPKADGTTCGSTYTEYQDVRPRLLPRSRENPSHTERAIGRNSPGTNGAPALARSGRLKMTDHSPSL